MATRALSGGGWPLDQEVAALGAVAVAVVLTVAGALWIGGKPGYGAGAVVAALLLVGGVLATMRWQGRQVRQAPLVEWSLVRAAADAAGEPLAVSGPDSRIAVASAAYLALFGGETGFETVPAMLSEAARAAWRDGRASFDVSDDGGRFVGEVARAGAEGEWLIWRFNPAAQLSLTAQARDLVAGEGGERLGDAGVMAALVTAEGTLLGANAAFAARAIGGVGDPAGRDFVALLAPGGDGLVRFAREPDEADPLRFVQVPLTDAADTAVLFLLLDEDGAGASAAGKRGTTDVHLHGLLGMLPLGLALADRDGRFIFINDAFRAAAGLQHGERPIYPGDLVLKEDKGAVADAVRRYAAGHGGSGDLPVRLRHAPDDPVALTVASARGLGDAAVLLSLKDSSEERKLKRQVAQATKMQAVGQLAGGVAHDFNNILTAIIGHCDLMLMRHTPGDSDYDDIQQIRHNSNRAANLTRQLLAFSRQQTLRPQVLQLPDVVAEVSHLLQRLIGDTVRLNVKHGRSLGAVRADPGQLEQVIVNLAVNARDAMAHGGTLIIQTYAAEPSEVRRVGHDILPPGDYTALRITDTGSGIPPEILPKIFEPFFTTKEVGKGTGLGLSTVYGIVKQTGGYIFAENQPGGGASFVIYLPVHRAERPPQEPRRPAAEPKKELWGTGTVLLVEDEDMVRAVAERALTRQGYRVLAAANGEEAIEVLDRHDGTVDLLISDVVMPSMDGPTTARAARERLPNLPVLFMSGYAEEQLRRSIDLPKVSFLPKPFSVQQLAEAVRRTLPESAA